jgi:tetratricopeptide (TPR) repeat protein
MKMTSRYALLAALGFSVAATTGFSPAFAKKKEEAPATPVLKLSEDVRKLLGESQAALAKGDVAGAQAKDEAAKAAAKTPDDQYVVAQIAFNIAISTKDVAAQTAALDGMIASGKLADADKPKFYAQQGHFAYDSKSFAKAEQAYLASVAAGSTDRDVYARLADTQSRNGKPVEALATLNKVIQNTTSGPLPSEWYARGADIASRAKLGPQFLDIAAAWLSAYPVKQNLHDTLFIYRQIAQTSGDVDLDLLRLARYAGVLPLANQASYLDYALAVYLKFPNEAVTVLKDGIAVGKLNPATNQNTREILALSQPKIAGDKASLAGAVTAANSPKSNFKSVLATADAFAGYGDYAKAIDLYKLALTKAGADTGVANLRLAVAQVQSGNKEAARATFAAVTGPETVIARLWLVQLDHPAQ